MSNRPITPSSKPAPPRRSTRSHPGPSFARLESDRHSQQPLVWQPQPAEISQQQQREQQQGWNGYPPQFYQPQQAQAYAPREYQRGPAYQPQSHQHYGGHQHLPSATPPFHSTAPLQAQRPRYQEQFPQNDGHYSMNQRNQWTSQPPHSDHQGGTRGGQGQGQGGVVGGRPEWRQGNQGQHWSGKGQSGGWRGQGGSRPEERQRSRFAQDYGGQPNSSSATPEPSGDMSARPTPFERRKKAPRATGAPPPPTDEYLASTLLPPTLLSPGEDSLPPLLILDLNNTLICRKRSAARGSKTPIVRPYLSTFLQYVCGASQDGLRRWETAVYSSAASHNVLSLLEAIRLIPLDRAHEHEAKSKGKPWDARPGEALNLVWSREKMNLSEREFTQNVETCKDLEQVWSALPSWDSKRSVLLDDEAMKAAQHPHNHIPIHPFIIDPASVPGSPPPSPRRPRSPDSRSREPTPQPPFTAHPTYLPTGHPFHDDTSLLSTIYILDQLRHQANIGAWMRQIGLKGLDLQDEEQRVAAGREICEGLGIQVSRAWEADWWEKVPSWEPSEA